MRRLRILICLVAVLATAIPVAASAAALAKASAPAPAPAKASSATAGFAYVGSVGLLLGGAAYNSTGGGVALTHVGTGQYEVTFGKLRFVGGDVQVSSLQGIPCVVVSWGPANSALAVFVNCYDQFGDLVDAGFEVLVTEVRGQPNGVLDYDWVFKGSGRLTGSFQYNSSHKVNSVRHPAAGEYVVTMPGPGLKGASQGTVNVTAYGGGGSCQVTRWLTTGSGEQITVRCYNGSGAPQNRKFDIIYARANNLMGQNGKTTANAFANGSGVMYQPKAQFDSRRGARITILHLDRGFYEAVFIGSNTTNNANGGRGNIQVTPVSGPPRTCEIQPTFARTTIAFISCSNASLSTADTAFTIQYVVNG